MSAVCADGSMLPLSKENALRQILADHVARFPQLEAQDLYKLVFQGVMGCEHAASDAIQAREVLNREVAALAEGPAEPVIDPISVNGQMVRVNLRPYLASAGDLSLLVAAFIRTSHEHKGIVEELRWCWSIVEGMNVGELGIGRSELRDFFADMEARGFPALHHSVAYVSAYRPAYRVVRQEFLARE